MSLVMPHLQAEKTVDTNEQRILFLKEIITKTNTLTENVVHTLDTFDRRLQSLEDTVMPMYSSTNRLRTLLANIDKALVLSDNVLQFYTLYDDLHDYITNGPTGDISQYLRKLESLQGAIEYFKKIAGPNLNRAEFERVNSLLKTGQQRLMDECETLIRRYSQPYDSVYLANLHEQPLLDKMTPSQGLIFKGEDGSILRMIFNWFISQHYKFGPINLYGSSRGEMIRKSLLQFRRSLDGPQKADTSISVTSSPKVTRNESSPVTSRLHSTLRSGINKTLISIYRPNQSTASSSATAMDSFGGGHSSMLSNTSLGVTSEDNIAEFEVYRALLTLLFKLFQVERGVLMGIFPELVWDEVFSTITHTPLHYFQTEAERLRSIALASTDKKSDGSTMGIFYILSGMMQLRPLYARLFKEVYSNRQSQVAQVSITFEKTAAQILKDILEEIKSDPSTESNVAKGGGVQRLTYSVISFMDNLAHDYLDVACVIGSQLKDDQTTIESIFSIKEGVENTTSDEARLGIARYFVSVLKWLNTNLLRKSDCYGSKDPTIKSVFLLNNIYYILKVLLRSDLLQVISLHRSDIREQYENDIVTYRKEYSKCYSKLVFSLQRMLELQNTQRLPNTKLKDKEREMIKEGFTTINREIDTLISQHNRYIIHDKELRNLLRAENKSYILPLYTSFYNEFSRKEFSKHPQKYLKYPVEALTSHMDNFFERCS